MKPPMQIALVFVRRCFSVLSPLQSESMAGNAAAVCGGGEFT
jgi:hypothetical protein